MPLNPRDFNFHKLVIAHEIMVSDDVDGAIKYVDGVHDALAADVPTNPPLKEGLDDLETFLGLLRAVKDLAEQDKLTILEYVKQFKKR